MFALSQAQVATIAMDETTILEIKAISALPFKSSLTTWIVRWWQRVLPKGVLKFRAFVLLIKPVPLLFIFLSSLSSSWLFELASYVTVQNNWQYPTILLNNRRFDGKRAAQTTSAGTHWEAESWYIFDILRDTGGTHSFTMLYDKLLLVFHPERGCPFVSLT